MNKNMTKIKVTGKKEKCGESSRKFVNRALKESCEINFPKLLLFTFRELRIDQPVEWKNVIIATMNELEKEIPPTVIMNFEYPIKK